MFGGLNSLNSINKVVKFLNNFKKKKFTKIIYCPPNTLINQMSINVSKSQIEVGAQNCHENYGYGAYTGSINSLMLKNAGAKYVIIGHSEIRNIGETNKKINLKIKSALKTGLKVIFCIGETLTQKRKKITKKILFRQISNGLKKIKNKKNIIIAYEPVWSIGTGLIPKNSEIFEIVKSIKKKAKGINVLYGGSVNSKNINDLKKIDNLNGFLVGGASQRSKNFIDIIKKTFN